MEEKRVIKPLKPSGLKPPQIRTVKPLPSSRDINNKSPITVATSLMRRSKSVADLQHIVNKNTEGRTISKIRKPSSLKAPQIRKVKLQPLSENIINITSTNTVTTSSNLLSRRSKSVVDLRVVNKSKMTSKTSQNQKITSTSAVNKTAQKRKAEKSSDEVKPKVVKQVKIPDWDYKGRYNQLRERYASLNQENKAQKDRLEEFDVIEEKFSAIKNDYEALEIKYTALANSNTNTITENNILNKKVPELNDAVCKLTEECAQLKQQLDKITIENEELSKENKNLNIENKTLSTNFSNLKEDHLQLKQQHDELTNSYDNLKADYNEKLIENKELHLNLTLGSKRIMILMEQNNNLKKNVNNGDILRRNLHNTIQDLKGNIRVFCRVRPPLKTEEDNPQCLINFIDEKTIEIRKSRESISAISGRPTDIKAEFTVDKIFDPRSTQQEIFEDLSQLVQSALDGYDVCVFAYGQTGSGKTYTMQGEETSDKKGMIPRTIDLIFNSIKKLRTTDWNYDVSASFLEIYNENVKDLLNPDLNQNLEIRFNEGKGTTVTNLSIQKLNSAEELKNLMTIAQRNRAVAATDFNEHSSRSHAVIKIYLQGTNEELNVTYKGSINLVDLAGSESAKTSSNERLTETKNINKSLSALESVMLALYNKEKHIPYRNSKLTYLLQSCLGGSSKTLMVVNIAPFEECYTESIYSLRFAAKVKEVKMSAKRNKTNFVLSASNNKT